ncbi:MAG: hypothetical protein WBO35_04910, partial [Candidatus Saccharimonadales bacterium]
MSVPKKRSWTDEQLVASVAEARSIRMVLLDLGLIPAGGNYDQVKKRIKELSIDTGHFMGMGWNVGGQFRPRVAIPLEQLLQDGVAVQSFKLKSKLFAAGIKKPECELCGWAELSP